MEKQNYIKFDNGSILKLVSSDSPDAGRGKFPIPNQFDFFDEATEFDADKYDRINAVWNKDNPKYEPVKIKIDKSLSDKYLEQIKDIDRNFMSEFTNHVSSTILKQKEKLILNRIKKYIPDFCIADELKRKSESRLYLDRQGNETHYFLKHNNENIRLITFVTSEKPIENFKDKVQISVEEHYY